MDIISEPLPDTYLVRCRMVEDVRGRFVKTYNRDSFDAIGLEFNIFEDFYSISKLGVIRGMHFQLPPYAQKKLVYCCRGTVLDVLVDLRLGSPMFRRVSAIELTEERCEQLYIPEGVAHGFLCQSPSAMVAYKTSSDYSAAHDVGVRWNSIEFDWPIKNPIVSDRDLSFSDLQSFDSPFQYSQ